MTFAQFLSILRARWRVAILVLVSVIAVVVGTSLLLPKKYTAVASVVVDSKPDPVSAMMYPGMVSPSFMATQVDIIQSDRVAQRVVRNLKLADNPQVRSQWMSATGGEGDINVWLAESFQKSMDVKPSRESNVITVSYKAPDPRFAAALANAFVQGYIETALELRVDPAKQYSNFFDTRTKEAREALEKAQTKLSAFQREKGITVSDERLDIENARLNELSSQLVMLQTLAAESSSRKAQASGASAEKLQEVLANPVIAGLKSDLSRQQARLQELNSRLGDNNPQVVELKANIAELHNRIAEETRRVTGGVSVTSDINRSRESQVRAELEAQRTKVLQLKQVRDEGLVLVRDVENAQRAYEAVQARLNQTSLESQTTQSNVNILTAATPPLEPSSPRIIINSLIAVFAGTILSIGITMLLEMMDRRVRAAEDLPHALGLPLLGIIPEPPGRRQRLIGTSSTPNMMQRRLVGRLASPEKGA